MRTKSHEKLSPSQWKCLEHFIKLYPRGDPNGGFLFGASTLTSLRKLGLIEKYRACFAGSQTERTAWRAGPGAIAGKDRGRSAESPPQKGGGS